MRRKRVEEMKAVFEPLSKLQVEVSHEGGLGHQRLPCEGKLEEMKAEFEPVSQLKVEVSHEGGLGHQRLP